MSGGVVVDHLGVGVRQAQGGDALLPQELLGIAPTLGNPHCLEEGIAGLGDVAGPAGDGPEDEQGPREHAPIVEAPGQRERRAGLDQGRPGRMDPGLEERSPEHHDRPSGAAAPEPDSACEVATAFGDGAADVPVPGQRAGDPLCGLDITTRRRPVDRRPDVVDLLVEQRGPRCLVAAVQPWSRGLDQAQTPRRVTVTSLDELTARREMLRCILGDGLEHVVADAGPITVGGDQRLVDEPGHHVTDVARGWGDTAERCRGEGRDRLGRLQRESAREHREPLEDPAFVVVEQVVAPVDDTP